MSLFLLLEELSMNLSGDSSLLKTQPIKIRPEVTLALTCFKFRVYYLGSNS